MNRVTRIISIIVLPTIIYGQLRVGEFSEYPEIPQNCVIKPFMYRQCCMFPPFFNRDTAIKCGAKGVMMFGNRANITGFRRDSELGCRYWKCMLKRYDLVNYDEETVNEKKFQDHLSSWVDLNTEFKQVMLRAKLKCKESFKLAMPIKVCHFNQYNACIRHYVDVNCPQYIRTHECIELKKFYEECHEFYQ